MESSNQQAAREALLEAPGDTRQKIAALPDSGRNGMIVTFIGCKGGSGATFLATNLGYVLAEDDSRKVAVIDLNCLFGNASHYVSSRAPASTLADVARQVHRLDGPFLASSMIPVLPNYHVLAAPAEPEHALDIRPEQIDALLWTAASHYDIVIVDAGRSLDSITVRAMNQSRMILAVLQPALPFVRDARRLLHALSALGYGKDKVRLLVNRCAKGDAITLQDVARTLRHEVFRTVPNSFNAVADSINQGVPIVTLASRDPVAKALRKLARALAPDGNEVSGWLKGLLSVH